MHVTTGTTADVTTGTTASGRRVRGVVRFGGEGSEVRVGSGGSVSKKMSGQVKMQQSYSNLEPE